MQSHVQSCNRFHERETPAKVGERANRRGGGMAAPRHRLICADVGTPERDPRQPRGMASRSDGHFDRVARRKVETVQPRGGPTGEDSRHGQTPARGREHNLGVMSDGAQGVKAATESLPARTDEVILGQPIPSGLLKIEGTLGELDWNRWGSGHGPESWAAGRLNGTQPINGNEWAKRRQSTSGQCRSVAHSVTAEAKGGAGDGLRTRYLDLGKVALYQVSYSRSARGKMIPRPVRSPSPRGSARSAGPSGREAGSHAWPNRGWRRG